jgi:hypothetical protein
VLESTDMNDFADEISQPDRYVKYA